MLASFFDLNIFVSDVYMDNIDDILRELQYSHLEQYFI